MDPMVDCPECGVEKTFASCAKCHTCETVERVSNEYEAQLTAATQRAEAAEDERDVSQEKLHAIESKLRPLVDGFRSKPQSKYMVDDLQRLSAIVSAACELFPAQPSEET